MRTGINEKQNENMRAEGGIRSWDQEVHLIEEESDPCLWGNVDFQLSDIFHGDAMTQTGLGKEDRLDRERHDSFSAGILDLGDYLECSLAYL